MFGGHKVLGHKEAALNSYPGGELWIRGIWTQHSTSIFYFGFPRKQVSGFISKPRWDVVDPFTQSCFELTENSPSFKIYLNSTLPSNSVMIVFLR